MPLAGVFNHWRNAKGQLVPNVAVVTMASGKWLSWCHHRMPVILDTPEKLDVRMTEMTEIN
jgi:putative SOS response-associated peptidase YedK